MKTEEKIERLASALRKLTRSASLHFGADCLLNALLAQKILLLECISTQLVTGRAAWRVGPGDTDVISHCPQTGGIGPAGVKSMAYHAWLTLNGSIIDFTTHSLRDKAKTLDAMDGGTTAVLWCPNYLFIAQEKTLAFNAVTQAAREGVACYEEVPGLFEFMSEHGLVMQVADEDIAHLHILYMNPDMQVVGPNDLPTHQ